MADPSLSYFLSLPWCAAILNHPSTTVVPTRSRTRKPSSQDELLAYTLATPDTIPHVLIYYTATASPLDPISQVSALFHLEGGLNGYPNICHGGIIATLLDEALGLAYGIFAQREHEIAEARGEKLSRAPSMTAELVTTYVRPLRTPQTVRIVIKGHRREGRKTLMEADVLDGEGVLLAKGTGLFVQLKKGGPRI